METALLIDIGSTFTKAVALDLDEEELIGWSSAPTTVQTDVTIGLSEALSNLRSTAKFDVSDAKYKLACSSAAGGLRMAVVGLVPELTAEAGNRAALGAGAKVTSVYSYGLSPRDKKKLEQESPDMVLLTGGTDGGNEEVIINSARVLARSKLNVPIVVAGNKNAVYEVERILKHGGKSHVRVTDNVLPELNKLDLEPARTAVRQIFIERIVEAKGISKARKLVDDIIMPTHAATLEAAELLADGCEKEKGIGELLVVEVGGATVNVHSVAEWRPASPAVIMKGLPEPRTKRTVEGDLGIRYNAASILKLAGKDRAQETTGLSGTDIEREAETLSRNISRVPKTELEFLIDSGLARMAVEIAVGRHVGTIKSTYTPVGEILLQYGKDFREIGSVVGTGGPVVYSRNPRWILEGALYNEKEPNLLRPRKPRLLVDKKYIMFAVGLLRKISPQKALRIIRRYTTEIS